MLLSRILGTLGVLVCLSHAVSAQSVTDECGQPHLGRVTADYLEALARGDIQRPTPPVLPPPGAAAEGGSPGVVTRDDIFLFEDSGSVLITDFEDIELLVIMADSANALLAAYGDVFDFIGFWLSYTPHHTIGLAFYYPVTNDVSGIGNPFQDWGLGPMSDLHGLLGLSGQDTQGLVMMWDVNNPWVAGAGPSADFTRLAIQHEIGHRFNCYLAPMQSGMLFQGDFSSCGSPNHWNYRVDNQGGCLYVSEWVGTSPAVPVATSLSFNTTEIPGGTYSLVELYLMGMVSAAELDGLSSEFRYMNTSNCTSNYFGPITQLSSADIVATNGARSPTSATSQKDFDMAWIMIHLPGDEPTTAELDKAAAILNQSTVDFSYSTMGRGTIDHTLPGGFEDVGSALPGSNGTPSLVGEGSLLGGSPARLALTNGLPSGFAYLILGFSAINAPFKGGTLVPAINVLLPNLPLDGSGGLTLDFTWGTGLPSGLETHWQYWIPDAGAVFGFAASNAVLGTTP